MSNFLPSELLGDSLQPKTLRLCLFTGERIMNSLTIKGNYDI